MTSPKLLTKYAVLFGSVLIGLSLLSVVASAAPVAQLSEQQSTPEQQSTSTGSITIPSTGAVVQYSQIRVASVPPAPQNPCPSIYYEVPYSQYVVVPQVCRPNLITQQLDQMGMLRSIVLQVA